MPLDFESAEGELQNCRFQRRTGPKNCLPGIRPQPVRTGLDRLRSRMRAKGKALHFQLLELYDIEEGGRQLTYD